MKIIQACLNYDAKLNIIQLILITVVEVIVKASVLQKKHSV